LMYATLVQRSIANQEELGSVITHLDEKLNKSTDNLPEEARVFLDLRQKYPEPDVGLLSIFLMNLIHLEKGQAVFLKAGIPHAYLEGNIVECMANSDNVVRAGLTHKFKDVETLTEILTYELGPVTILESDPASQVTYQTDASEFQVSRMRMKPGREIRVRRSGPRVLLLTEGEVHIKWNSGPGGSEESLRQGQSVFVPACLREFQITSNSSTELFMAEVPSH
jgi:mannose-6-phosphate isomerase